jgi:hypothetical protein
MKDWARCQSQLLLRVVISSSFADIVARFVATPISTVNTRLSKEAQTFKSEIAALEKRLHYLETTHKNSREHIDKILQTGGRS